jgi:hypothetical protein
VPTLTPGQDLFLPPVLDFIEEKREKILKNDILAGLK